MKRTGIVALVACLVALCLALASCGGGGKKAEEAKAAFVGNWTIYSIESTDGTRSVSNNDIVLLQEMDQNVTLSLSEDGTAKLDIFGSAMDGTWEAKNPTTGTAVLNGANVALSIGTDGKLSFTDDSKDKIIFTKGGATATAVAPKAAETTNEAASTEGEAATEETATDEAATEEAPAEETATEEAPAEEAA